MEGEKGGKSDITGFRIHDILFPTPVCDQRLLQKWCFMPTAKCTTFTVASDSARDL